MEWSGTCGRNELLAAFMDLRDAGGDAGPQAHAGRAAGTDEEILRRGLQHAHRGLRFFHQRSGRQTACFHFPE